MITEESSTMSTIIMNQISNEFHGCAMPPSNPFPQNTSKTAKYIKKRTKTILLLLLQRLIPYFLYFILSSIFQIPLGFSPLSLQLKAAPWRKPITPPSQKPDSFFRVSPQAIFVLKPDEIMGLQQIMKNRKSVSSTASLCGTTPQNSQNIDPEECCAMKDEDQQNFSKNYFVLAPSANPSGRQLRNPLSSRERGGCGCVWAMLACLLCCFLVAEYALGVHANFLNTKRFIENLQTLRNSNYLRPPERKGREERMEMRGMGGFGGRQQQQRALKLGEGRKKWPQTPQVTGQSSPVLAGRADGNPPYAKTEDPASISPPASAPAAAVGSPSFASFQHSQEASQEMNPIANNQHDQNPDNFAPARTEPYHMESPDNPSQSVSTAFAGSPPPQNNPQSNFNPLFPSPPKTAGPQIKVTPTIPPFVPQKTLQSNNPFGSFAGITPPQLESARQRRSLIDANWSAVNPVAVEQKEYYQSRYKISSYAQLPFCIVVPTYNNAEGERYLRNIKSILMQDYSNFHIVVMDDHSQDSTGELIRAHLAKQEAVPESRYKVIRNEQQLRAMANIRTAAREHCKPEEIFLIVDGDDELLGRQVLKLFNAVFQEKQLWFVYSNFLTMAGAVGFSRPFPAATIITNGYRHYPFVTSHLRAFYTKLLVNIREEDVRDDAGEYFHAANDVAICIPVLEQSHERVGYLPELTYFYNANTGLNNHQIRLGEQRMNDRRVREKGGYKRLEKLLD